MDKNFIFECSTRYLTSERSQLVRYWVEHEKIKFISTSGHVILCLLYKHTNEDVLTILRRFPTTFRRFPKIFQNCSEGQVNASEHFPNIIRTLSEDCRRRPKKIRRCFDHTSTNLNVIKGRKEKCYKKGMISSQCER